MDERIRNLFTRLLLVVLPFISISCIKESSHPTCPEQSQYTVTIAVKDKNYANVGGIPELMPESENLPFSAYVQGISYRLENLATKQIIEDQAYQDVDPQEMTHTLVFNNIPNGRYLLTTLGNLPPTTAGTKATDMLVTLHDERTENTDVYMGMDTLNFDNSPHVEAEFMGRLKGVLLVICKNFPVETSKITLQVDSVHLGTSEAERNYAEATYVSQSFDPTEELLQMYLAPTVPDSKSSLILNIFIGDSSTPIIIVPDIKIVIERNMVTEIMIDFNAEMEKVIISIRINGVWEKINEMHIDIE